MVCAAAVTRHNQEAKTPAQEKQSGECGEANNSTPDKVIVKPDHLKSAVWRFFGFWSVGGEAVHKSKAVCKLCILCNYAGISLHYQKNLAPHLVNVHPAEWNESLSKQAKLTAFYSPTASLLAAKQEAITKN